VDRYHIVIHERLDIDGYKAADPLAQLRAAGVDTGIQLPSRPQDMALIEQLREEAASNLSVFERVPTDMILWQAGEPDRREVTKIRGAPYREAGKPWPLDTEGAPLNFVAQFCFSDSRDLVPPLPGDVLLIFAAGQTLLSLVDNQPFYVVQWGDGLFFEWVSLGDFPLAKAAEIPATPWPVMPCFGSLYLTWDCRVPPDFDLPESHDGIAVLDGSKIGGVCPWILDRDYTRLDQEIGIPGAYLCTLGSVSTAVYTSDLEFFNPSPPSQWGVHEEESWQQRRAHHRAHHRAHR